MCVDLPPWSSCKLSNTHAFDLHVPAGTAQQVGRCQGCRWVTRRHDRPGRCQFRWAPCSSGLRLGFWPLKPSSTKAMSLLVVATVLPPGWIMVPGQLTPHWPISRQASSPRCLLGAYLSATWATCMQKSHLTGPRHPVDPDRGRSLSPSRTGATRRITRATSNDYRRRSRSRHRRGRRPHGVAGGELLIPTIVLLYGADIKIARQPLLAVSLPTMLVAFARYSQTNLRRAPGTTVPSCSPLPSGSVAGTAAGGSAPSTSSPPVRPLSPSTRHFGSQSLATRLTQRT